MNIHAHSNIRVEEGGDQLWVISDSCCVMIMIVSMPHFAMLWVAVGGSIE